MSRSARILPAVLLVLAASAARADERTDYMLECQGCHLEDGSGTPGKVPALRGRAARFLVLPDGRAYTAQVPGVANSHLSDARLARLLSWTLRTFDGAHVPADFEPYSAEEVARLRANRPADVAAERARLEAELRSRSPIAPATHPVAH